MNRKNIRRIFTGCIFWGCPYPSNGTETSLDVTLWTFSKTLRISLNCQQSGRHNFEEITRTLVRIPVVFSVMNNELLNSHFHIISLLFECIYFHRNELQLCYCTSYNNFFNIETFQLIALLNLISCYLSYPSNEFREFKLYYEYQDMGAIFLLQS